jgi:Hemerythrin HHE cation binding domain
MTRRHDTGDPHHPAESGIGRFAGKIAGTGNIVGNCYLGGQTKGYLVSDVFEVLSKDHEEIENILRMLDVGPHGPAATGEKRARRRRELATRLVIVESRHEALEETYVWPAVRELVPGGEDLVDRAIWQETNGKELLSGLEKADDTQFEIILSRFALDGRGHIAFEEAQVWPALRSVISAAQAYDLGEKIDAGRRTAPTRPHPSASASPKARRTAGVALAAADRIRDKVTHRGRT